jgi:hypothetical protein
VPTVAIVAGVKIQLYAQEHPPPHFHAVFAEFRAQIAIDSLRVLNGTLPPAKLTAVLSWAAQRRRPLLEAWETVLAKERPEKIR